MTVLGCDPIDQFDMYTGLVRSVFMSSVAKAKELSHGRDPIRKGVPWVVQALAKMPSNTVGTREEQKLRFGDKNKEYKSCLTIEMSSIGHDPLYIIGC
jgi:hypothetical protein